MIKVIVFDFDGVLVESVDIKTKAFARLFEAEGEGVVNQIVDYHVKHAGVSRFEKFKYFYRVFLKRELTADTFNNLCKRFSGFVVDEVIRAPFVKGAKEFLDRYAETYECYIASATPQQEIEDIIKYRGMARYFKGVCGSPKSKEDCVKDIMRERGIAPEEMVYVGDALSDYLAATLHGAHFIARINGNEDIFMATDCMKVMDLIGLKGVIDRIGSKGDG